MAETNKQIEYVPRIDWAAEKDDGETSPGDLDSPDRRDGRVYVHDKELELIVEVALTTRRPLLLRGEPGSGKSSLAAYVARKLGWRYYECVVTARTQAQDLLWTYDMVRRLKDAQTIREEGRELNDYDYVEPGHLWWAFNRESAKRRGAPESPGEEVREAVEPNGELNETRSPDHAVLLIDEIDKADPDVPNNLLVPLGSWEFNVTDTDSPPVSRSFPAEPTDRDRFLGNLLVAITTNEERDLPEAFLRRCVIYRLEHPDRDRLVEIAKRHLEVEGAKLGKKDTELLKAIADKVEQFREQARNERVRAPGTAEYLDAVRACRNLNISVGSGVWERIAETVLRKWESGEERKR